ncbi:DUF6248 family natural product biosynthesis protein [Streptomyces griseorubiginosus]|uniref:DUF6248 family natural product biosynthesis protein n=1 Tax=Streptomyces griseorubiginosus TaxID=67304 RepID=UPI00362B17CD
MNALVRPQRKLTEQDYEAIHRTPLMNLHGALYTGIVDPVPNPSPMSEAEGAWVREHVWTEPFTAIDRKYPFGFWRWSMCERGTCWNCLNKRCDICVHRQKGAPHVDRGTEGVHNHLGQRVAALILRPGGERCVWWCRCPCAKTGPAPARPGPPPKEPAAEPPPAEPAAAARPQRRPLQAPAVGGQLPLPGAP